MRGADKDVVLDSESSYSPAEIYRLAREVQADDPQGLGFDYVKVQLLQPGVVQLGLDPDGPLPPAHPRS